MKRYDIRRAAVLRLKVGKDELRQAARTRTNWPRRKARADGGKRAYVGPASFATAFRSPEGLRVVMCWITS